MCQDTRTSEISYDSRRLFSLYSCFFVTYLAVVVVLALIGVEAIYLHTTPFYCVYSPIFRSLIVPTLIALSCTVVWLVAWYPLFMSILLKRSFWFWVLVLILAATAYDVHFFVTIQMQPLSVFFGEVFRKCLHHMGVVVLAAGMFVAVNRAFSSHVDQWSRKQVFYLLIGLYVFSVVLAISLSILRNGVDGLTAAYSRQTYEYIGDIGKGSTIRGLFRDYIKIHPYLSMHSKVHPPGPVVLLWLLADLGAGRTPLGLSIATVLFGSLSIFPLYAWVCEIGNRQTAFIACLLYCFSPMIVLFTATSADILFMPFTLTTLYLFSRSLRMNSYMFPFAAGLFYALMSILSFSLISVGIFFAFAGLTKLFSRERRGAVLRTACMMLLAFVIFHLLLRLWSGFDVVECFRVCKQQFDKDQFFIDRLGPRYPSWMWKVLNPMAWIFFVGVPVTILWFQFIKHPGLNHRADAFVFVATLLVLDLLYLARGEGERSAMYVFPFFVAPAALRLSEWVQKEGSRAPLAITLTFMMFQCWFIESFFYTYW